MKRSLRRVGFALVSLAVVAVAAAACGGHHGGGGAKTPILVSVSPAHATVGANVLLSGSNFGATQGASTVDFGGTIATVVSWSSHQIVATVPTTLYPGSAPATVTVKTTASTQPFDVVLPDAVYVDDNDTTATNNAIEGFSISSSGALVAMPGSPWKLGERARSYGGDAQTVRVDAVHRRLYVSGYDFVHPFDIDPQTGVLTARPPVFVEGSGTLGLGIIPGKELFTSNCDSNRVGALLIGSSGSLTPAPGSPFALTGGQGEPIIVYPVRGGKFLWALDGTTLAELSGWSVQADGSLAPLVVDSHLESASAEIFGGVVAPAGDRILLPAFGTSQLIMVDVNAGTGTLTEAAGSPLTVPYAPNATAFSADGAHAFAAPYGTDNVVYEYDVGGNGALGFVGSAQDIHFATMSAMATDAYDRWLLIADETGQTLGIFSLAGQKPVPIGNNVNLLDVTANASGIAVTP